MKKTLEEIVAEAVVSNENRNGLKKELYSYRNLERIFKFTHGVSLVDYIQGMKEKQFLAIVFVCILDALFAVMFGILGGIFMVAILGENTTLAIPTAVAVTIITFIMYVKEHHKRYKSIDEAIRQV